MMNRLFGEDLKKWFYRTYYAKIQIKYDPKSALESPVYKLLVREGVRFSLFSSPHHPITSLLTAGFCISSLLESIEFNAFFWVKL
jgi:hypothetical protein